MELIDKRKELSLKTHTETLLACPLLTETFLGTIIGNKLIRYYNNSQIRYVQCLPMHIDYINYTDRFLSLESKLPINITPQIAESGFYCPPGGNIAICFFCGAQIPLHQFKNNEIWILHALVNKNCFYLIQKKGELFITELLL